MQTKLNLVFLLCLFSISTSLYADNDTRLADTLEMLKKEFPTIQCNQEKLLTRYEGHYVTKAYWIGLEKTKSHALSANQESNLMTVNIGKDGFVGLGYSYHEGVNFECTFEKDNVLWSCVDNSCEKLQIDHQKQIFISKFTYELKELASLPKGIPMVGPLIRVGKSRDYSVYFEKIFQHKCYTSDVGEKWCFGKNEITIDKKVQKAYLKLDMSEIPEYGNTLTFDNDYNEDMFVFVPYNNGWKIFQDTWLTIENHIPVNPLTDKPWRILRE